MAKRAGYVNNEQRNMLLEYLKKNPKLTEGKFSNNFSYKDSQKLWEEITNILNSVPNGGSKNWKQWRKVWQHIKTKTKTKSALIKRYSNKTGGGPPSVNNLNDTDLSVLEIVSPTAIEGIANVQETVVPSLDIIIDQGEYLVTENIPKTSAENKSDSEALCFEISEVLQDPDEAGTPSVLEENVYSNNKLNKTEYTPRFKKSKAERIEKTLTISDNLTNLTEKKIKMKEEYYKKKLILYEQHINILKNDLDVKKDILQELKALKNIVTQKTDRLI